MDSSPTSPAFGPAPSTSRSPNGTLPSVDGHAHDLTPFLHDHLYENPGAAARSRALVLVSLVTLATMVLELVVGYASGSRALTADGWHMATHVVALGGAALAARLARGVGSQGRFAFGGWKIEVLAAYTSGLFLLAVAGGIAIDAAQTLASPAAIEYREAMVVAVLGLMINLACAWILMRSGEDHGHRHDRSHDGGHAHPHAQAHAHDDIHAHVDAPVADLNFNAATVHVVADAFTSVLAIAALAGAWLGGWRWLDPLVAIVGAAVIARWAYGVIRTSAATLVDGGTDPDLLQRIRDRIEGDGDARIADLHAWQIASGTYAAVVSIVADAPLPAQRYNERLASLPGLRHVTVEVHRCRGEAAAAAGASG